jgi:NAD(P)-dependent dehydrogenase (short-subunit alcohol dehydrogenase family)
MGMVDGKIAIITGATSGIGARTAELFVAEGAKVGFTGRRQAEGAAVAARIGQEALFVQADATCEDDWRRVTDHTLKAFWPHRLPVQQRRWAGANGKHHQRVRLPVLMRPWRCWCDR